VIHLIVDRFPKFIKTRKKEGDIIKLFGKDDTKIQGKDSFVLVYFTSQSGQINFTFKDGTLSAIGFTHTV